MWVTLAIRAMLIIFWRQGVLRKTRWTFWRYLVHIMQAKPRNWQYYLSICALGEHFLEYRQLVRQQIEQQLDEYLRLKAAQDLEAEAEKEKTVAA